MDVEIDLRRSIADNAARYYEMAKKARKKAKRIRELLERGVHIAKKEKVEREKKRKRKWFEKFRWFYSKNGFLVVAGRNANQNERLYKSVMKDDDLFLHAEIVGAPFTIVKKGINADDETLNAAAQFAVSYSRAWKFGYAAADAYAVGREQLTKKTSGEYVKKGGIIVKGNRRWFKNAKLGLLIGLYKNRLACFPKLCSGMLRDAVGIIPGSRKKEEIAKEIAKRLNADVDEVLALLPAGESDISE